jgi:CheY-like chemotaxis protein
MSSNRVLLVEDEAMLREAFRILLEDGGYHVSEAGTAAEARDAIAHELPNLILLDLGLPDASGLELAREWKNDPRTAGVVIVALTGRVGAEEKQACLDAGCKAYYVKPVSPKQLLKALPGLLA